MDNLDYIVYLLVNSSNNFTYIGMTNNPILRLKKHNCELYGGAKYTRMKKGDGKWDYYGIIPNLDKSTALSIEKKIQKNSKKTNGKTPLEKRVNCINKILLEYEHLYIEFIIFNE